MIDQLPQYRAHLSRHGHNLNHKFDFTSSTGHLLTLFTQIMNPKETISGKVDMFSRTQPLNSPSHVDIDTYIDYFFVPLDMLYSGFGDTLYQTQEPYSTMISVSPNTLPLFTFGSSFFNDFLYGAISTSGEYFVNFNVLDFYKKDSFFMSVYRNMFHNYLNPNFLFSALPDEANLSLPADQFQPNVLPLDLLAYNCVYENFYRLDEREQFDNTLYNIDSAVYSSASIFSNAQEFDNVFGLKYRPLGFDYFTSAKVAPLINGLNIKGNGYNFDLTSINNYLSANNLSLTSTGDIGGSMPLAQSAGVGIPIGDSSRIINVNNVRSMFAVEKILSVTGRAKKTYDAQVMAHLGVNVPRDVKHEITFVGSQRGSIKVGEIIAVAGTSDTPLGDMAGKGYGTVSNKPIKFTAPCHGIFIAIYSAVPKLSYYAPLEKAHCITSRLDFWHPEFEKLGMQPIFGYEVVPFIQTSFRTSVYGWQMRYEQYKRRFDKVSPAFANTIVNMSTGTPFDPRQIDYRAETFNTWKNWVLSIRPFRQEDDSTSLSGVDGLKRFLSSPTDLNDIMSVSYGWFNDDVDTSAPYTHIPAFWKFQPVNSTEERTSFGWNVASLFYRDPLLHFANIDFKLVSSMGENTLPDLNS